MDANFVGSQILKLRKNLKKSQNEFAEPLEMSGSAISLIEKGKGISMPALRKISETYGVPVEELISPQKIEMNSQGSYWQSIVEDLKGRIKEYQERELHYRETISQLSSKLGKLKGNTDAIVAGFKSIRLQSGLHRLRHAA